ncbi:ion transporter [Ruania halotolerans]|uniref:ion transporter n=1 Tax=Ruania halotolerans TaxID=2897773 RepID=UPI001E645CBD|nr:ion transporter [Ruania halotolerans]UFU05941.1 ion transporter [Ruania halotolerans]
MPAAPGTREERWENRLAWPVLIAALASVPAIFLTLLPDPMSTWGTVANILSGIVLTAETVVLFAVSSNKRAWVRRNWWLIALTLVVVAGVALALGPVQLLRLIRAIGALRVIRVSRIVKAGRILGRRLDGTWAKLPAMLASALVALFVAIVLADPTSFTRELLDDIVGERFRVPIAIGAGLVLAVATFVVIRNRENTGTPAQDRGSDPGDAEPDSQETSGRDGPPRQHA